MARKKRKPMSLSQPPSPRTGDIEALFAGEEDAEQAAGMVLVALRIDMIQPDPYQPRRTFNDDSLKELSESIRQDGVIQPIEVTEVRPQQYIIVHGERRWRAAKLAGLDTIPAVVRRRDYDDVTRFVRQLVENIQREDLNDLDRAEGIQRLRDLMQEELDRARDEDIQADEPWGKTISWAKVGKRLGYSRQRISQLMNLKNLPEDIQHDVRQGVVSERETRFYHGLRPSQQRALHQERLAGAVTDQEAKQIAKYLKDHPDDTVAKAIRQLRAPEPKRVPPPTPPQLDKSLDPLISALRGELVHERPLRTEGWGDEPQVVSTGGSKIDSIKRLDYVRGHLARIDRSALTPAERKEILRLLHLIQEDVQSLIQALE